MKIIVVSDSHGLVGNLQTVLELHRDLDRLIHLGDGESDMYRLLECYPDLEEKLTYCKGNCDGGRVIVPSYTDIILDTPYGFHLFACHGDYYRVKYGTNRLAYEAKKRGACIALYGHSHVRDCRYEDGLYIMNPGSVSIPRDGNRPSYGYIDLSPKGIVCNVVDVPR